MRKVWIASILTILMLTVPISSVVSANEVEDCNCNSSISDSKVVRIERLLDELESRINFILLRYGYILEVKEKCEDILCIINSDDFLELFCDILSGIVEIIIYFQYNMPMLLWVIIFFPPGLIISLIYRYYCKEGQNYPIPEITNL